MAFEGLKRTVLDTADEIADAIDDTKGMGRPRFCSECGTPLKRDAVFCCNCGHKVKKPGQSAADVRLTQEEAVQLGIAEVPLAGERLAKEAFAEEPLVELPLEPAAQEEYIGKVQRCQSCGCIVTERMAVCPDCGAELSGRRAVYSVALLQQKIAALEAQRKPSGLRSFMNAAGFSQDPIDQQELALIRSFPIPNTVDDCLEIFLLALGSINVGLCRQSRSAVYLERGQFDISKAWVVKMEQAYAKASILFPEKPEFQKMERLYNAKMEELGQAEEPKEKGEV